MSGIPALHVEEVCRRGQGAATCRYLMWDGDWLCAKGTPLEAAIDERAAQMNAKADNCPGWNKAAKALSIWTIYDHPSDHPDSYVARLWFNDQPTQSVMIAAELETLREALLAQMGLTRLERSPDDDPTIVEVWL